MYYLRTLFYFITITICFFTPSCKKAKPAEDTTYATQHLAIEQAFNDVQNIADLASTATNGGHLTYRTTATTLSQCASVLHLNHVITVDFGSENCSCNDNRNRKGKITINYSGDNYGDSGSVHTIAFDNYYQDNNKITGTKTVTNMGTNTSRQQYTNIKIEGTVTMASGDIVAVAWTRVRTQTAGYATLSYLADDVYQVTGSGTMTLASGNNIDIDITSPIVLGNSCHWAEAGTVTYNVSGVNHILDFGDTPACDDQATITLKNGSQSSITLP